MAYTPKEWKDLPDETTPIQASDLNHLEQGVGDLSTNVDTLNTNVGDLSTLNTTEKSNLVGAINEAYQNNIYSSEETVIGKWIDGKPIYRKVINSTCPSKVSTWVTVTSDLNADEILSYTGYTEFSTSEHKLLANGTPQFTYFQLNKTSNELEIATNDTGFFGKPIKVIIEYTKTTD